MKIFKVLLVVAIALGMMACNNEQDVPEISGEKDASISIKVFPSSNSPGLRSVGDLSDEDATTSPGLFAESAIKQLEVWVFSGDVLTGYGTAAAAEVTNIEAIAGASTVVVVANAGIGIIASKEDLLDEVKELPAEGIADGLVMTAEPFDVILMAGNNYYGYTDAEFNAKEALDPSKKTHLADGKTALPLVRVNARVALVSATVNYSAVPATQKEVFDELKDVEVAMFNVPKETYLFGASLAKNADFQYGVQWPSPDFSYVGALPAVAAPNALLDEGPLTLPTTLHNLIENTNAPYFYVNENTSTVVGDKTATTPSQKMIIVLRAKPYKDGDPVASLTGLYTDDAGYTYYPVWVNKDGIANPSGVVGDGNVYRNTQYNVTLTINGLGRPSIDPVDKAFLDVKVEVKAWEVVNQNVVWGTPPVAP
ncbi:putative secreted protein [Fermentimonas caenicola]|jgi:hypothetical protein|uniref:Putative secreted protein n=1 Tax=Fermentimonas caenicola TaxID=1562970 RepID=A0A098BYT5_9BACT|nr:putative secreted protein [Fermentimonas caenicola]